MLASHGVQEELARPVGAASADAPVPEHNPTTHDVFAAEMIALIHKHHRERCGGKLVPSATCILQIFRVPLEPSDSIGIHGPLRPAEDQVAWMLLIIY